MSNDRKEATQPVFSMALFLSLSFSLISFILYFFYRFVYALPRSPFVGDNNIQELKLSFSLSRHTQNEWKQQHNFEVVCTYVRTLSNAHFFFSP